MNKFTVMLLWSVIASLGSSFPVAALSNQAPNNSVRLLTIPTNIYRTTSNSKEALAGWVFFLIVQSETDQPIIPVDLTLSYSSKGEVVREEILEATALQTVDHKNYPPARLTGSAPSTPTYWPHAFRIHSQLPTSLNIDEVIARLRIVDPEGSIRVVVTVIPITTYLQKTRLIFPFKGKGIVTQGGALEAGHRNRSGIYAIDGIGLSANYAPVLKDDSSIKSYAGWSRRLEAPAAGNIIYARNDRPDQPVDGVSDPKFYAPEYSDGGDPGNSIVIDHGNGEFSMIAHMQKGSVRVRVGDAVVKGQTIGLLGNSGDTSGPHVHYQLQNGPRWEFADGLPATFDNVKNTSRGAFFDAK